jgi:hypothetical protein
MMKFEFLESVLDFADHPVVGSPRMMGYIESLPNLHETLGGLYMYVLTGTLLSIREVQR